MQTGVPLEQSTRPVWHGLDGVHDIPVVQTMHVPLLHTPAPPSGSEHEPPLLPVGVEHVPVFESQVPATWHTSIGVQVTGCDPVHTPLMHE